MYATIRRYDKIPSDKYDEVLRRFIVSFVPRVSKLPGFFSYYMMETEKGSIVSVSVFKDKNGAEGSNKLALDWGKDNLGDLGTKKPKITIGKLAVCRRYVGDGRSDMRYFKDELFKD